jgi:CheY-like chemotaxis protein
MLDSGDQWMAGETILIIEDNPANMELATDLLEVSGYKVLQAVDAEAGIEIARSSIPHLILMDVGLPGMDGLTAAGLMRKDPAMQDIPIVMLTAHAMHGDPEKAFAAGCNGYIAKPIDTRGFAGAIAAFISARQS